MRPPFFSRARLTMVLSISLSLCTGAAAALNHLGMRGCRCNLLEKRQPLAPDRVFDVDESRDVAAWMRQACYKTFSHRIGYDDENNWNVRCLAVNRRGDRRCVRHDEIGLESNELLGKLANLRDIRARPA